MQVEIVLYAMLIINYSLVMELLLIVWINAQMEHSLMTEIIVKIVLKTALNVQAKNHAHNVQMDIY